MLSFVLFTEHFLSFVLLDVQLLTLKLRAAAAAGGAGCGALPPRHPGWGDVPGSSGPAQAGNAEPDGSWQRTLLQAGDIPLGAQGAEDPQRALRDAPKRHLQAGTPATSFLCAEPKKARCVDRWHLSEEQDKAGGTTGQSPWSLAPGIPPPEGSVPGAPTAPSLPLPPLIDTFLLPRLFWSVTMAIPCLNRVLVNLFTIPIITFSNPG